MNENKNTEKTKKTYTDYNIFQGKVRLISENGESKIIERDEAIDIAKSQGMNLVQIAYNKNEYPHAICKIINYGKWLYQQSKNEKRQKQRERQNSADLKEITFSIRIDTGDKNTKIDHIRKFLEDGDNVKVIVKLSKREMNLTGMAKDLLKEVCASLIDISEFETLPSMVGCFVSCVLRKKRK